MLGHDTSLPAVRPSHQSHGSDERKRPERERE
jgi:hypothetical protein